MVFYFVDYENVHVEGFKGLDRLAENDVVCVMYTEQSRNMPLDIIERLNSIKVKLELYKAGTGSKNSLDFQLSTYLGYVIAKNEGRKAGYYIISMDTGYDRVVDFWRSRGIEINRAFNLAGEYYKEGDNKPLERIGKKKTRQNTEGNTDAEHMEEAAHTEEAADESQCLNEQPEISGQAAEPKKRKKPAAKRSSGARHMATKEELLKYLGPEEYTDRILEIFNSHKTKQSINNGLAKEFKDSKRSSVIYKKLKELMKAKYKT